MANEEHLEILSHGVGVWNKWRNDAPFSYPDLTGANLSGKTLRRIDLRDVDLSGADLSDANLTESDFCHTKLVGANLRGANLFRADFFSADMTGVDLTGSNLEYSVLVETDINQAIFEGCRIYGISVWNLKNSPRVSSNLLIKCANESTITVENLEVAQFIYLIFDNKKIRDAIDSMASKVVLILGRFTPERKRILKAIHKALSEHEYLPVLFDFEKPDSQDFIEPVTTLAHLSKFVIADVTDARIVIEELTEIVRNIAVPLKPILLEGSGDEPVTLFNLRRNHLSLLDTFRYEDCDGLVSNLKSQVIEQAEARVEQLRGVR
jgi:hypothetical protein